MNILIVDDEALARSRLRTLLSDCADTQRITVAEAANAGEALAQLGPTGGRAFDLVLLDIHMPGQDGLSLAHALQTLPQPPAVVFVTAHADHAVSAFELDAVDYLTKPVRRERLQQALAKVQRSARPPASAAAPRILGRASTTSSCTLSVRMPTDTSATTSRLPGSAKTGTTARTDGPSVPTYSSVWVRPACASSIDPMNRSPITSTSGWE